MNTHKNVWVYLFNLTLLFSQIEDDCGTSIVSNLSLSDIFLKTSLLRNECNTDDNYFLIRNDIYSFDPNDLEASYNCVEFVLVEFDDFTNIYVEKTEYENGRILDSAISKLFETFTDATPNAPIEYQNGIKEAEEFILGGSPPNVDNSGKVNILLLDVQDGYDGIGSYVAGYFDALDQEINGQCIGNCKDIIYIDSYPGDLTSSNPERALFTLAHEYQHLLHFASDNCEGYFTNCHNPWLNEGLSDLMPSILGLGVRDYSHFLTNTSIGLNDWSESDESSAPYYSKSALFLQYLYEYYEFGIGSEFDTGQDALTVVFNDAEEQGVESLINIIGIREFESLFKLFIEALSTAQLPSGIYLEEPNSQITLNEAEHSGDENILLNYELPSFSSVNIEIPTSLILLELNNIINKGILVSNYKKIFENNEFNYWDMDSTYYSNLIFSVFTNTQNSSEISFLVNSINYLNNLEKEISTYPNPVIIINKLNYLYESNFADNSNQLNIKIFNILGEEVSNSNYHVEQNIQTGIIDIDNISSGIYFLILTDNTLITKTKFTIIK